MSEDNRNAPEDRLVDYPYTATIWRNEGEKGPYFNVTLTRSFRDDNGEYQDTHSIPSKDILRVSELARAAHHRVNEIRRDINREHKPLNGREKAGIDATEFSGAPDDHPRRNRRRKM